MPEHGAAGGVLVLALLQAEVRFAVRKHALVAAGEPDLAPGPMRLLSARLVDCLRTQQNAISWANKHLQVLSRPCQLAYSIGAGRALLLRACP